MSLKEIRERTDKNTMWLAKEDRAELLKLLDEAMDLLICMPSENDTRLNEFLSKFKK